MLSAKTTHQALQMYREAEFIFQDVKINLSVFISNDPSTNTAFREEDNFCQTQLKVFGIYRVKWPKVADWDSAAIFSKQRSARISRRQMHFGQTVYTKRRFRRRYESGWLYISLAVSSFGQIKVPINQSSQVYIRLWYLFVLCCYCGFV